MDLFLTIEMMIKQAIERGEFENLPGEGKPLNLREFNPYATKEERLISRILARSGELPIEVIILKEIESLQEKLEDCKTEEKKVLKKKLEALNLKYEIQKEARLNFMGLCRE
jgi:hypothetical protein